MVNYSVTRRAPAEGFNRVTVRVIWVDPSNPVFTNTHATEFMIEVPLSVDELGFVTNFIETHYGNYTYRN